LRFCKGIQAEHFLNIFLIAGKISALMFL